MLFRWHIPKPRFFLLTLLFFVIFMSACMGIWFRWEPWACDLILNGHTGGVVHAAFSPNGQRIITSSIDKTACIWNAKSGKKLEVLAHTDEVQSGSYSPDGRWILTACGCAAHIWDAETCKELKVLNGHTDDVLSGSYSPDGRRIVTASMDATARVWDSATGNELMVLTGHRLDSTPSPGVKRLRTTGGRIIDYVYAASYSSDGQRIITAGMDGAARVWNAENGKELTAFKDHLDGAFFAAFSPDGRRISIVSGDNTVHIRDAVTGKELTVLKKHAWGVPSATFSPDGLRVVTASMDNTARIFDVETGKEISVLKGHNQYAYFASYSPDGRRIVTASGDCTARVWSRRHPEYWWGIAWLPESWVALLSGGGLLAGAIHNLRKRRLFRTSVPPEEAVPGQRPAC